MKKILSILLSCIMILAMIPQAAFADTGDVTINAANFPDANFREYVKTFDKNSDGVLSASELSAVTEISCSKKGIGSLKGIEYFTEIVVLDCRNNSLTSLDVSSNKKLWDLSCSGNCLTSIDVSGCGNLEGLNVSDNMLTYINVSGNSQLNFLSVSNNNLTSLNLSSNSRLEGINSKGNTCEIIPDSSGKFDLTKLPASLNISKTGSWSGGSVSGSILTVDKDADKVTYSYNTGLKIDDTEIYVDFTLIPLKDADKSSLSLFPQGFVYDGTEHTAAVKGFDSVNMNISGNKATEAGTYTIEITPKTGKWSDGTTGAVTGKWQIAKADPEYTVPAGLSGAKNKALSTVALPEGFSWMDGSAVMSTEGEQIYKAKYTPSDTKNYNVIENIDVKVNVADAGRNITVTGGKASAGAQAPAGTVVTITADAPAEGKVFDKWKVVSGGITLADASSPVTTFVMPDADVSVAAEFKDADAAAKNISDMTIKLSASALVYSGNSRFPTVTVTDSGMVLKKGDDYTVEYSNNKYVGTAKVTIIGTGAYTGTAVKTFKINPTKVTVSSVKKAASGKMKVTWKKHTTQTSGFQVQYSTSASFKGAKTVTVKSKSATVKTVSGLKKGKKYYVRVRAYRTVNKVNYYGSWSVKRSVRV